MKKPVQQKSRHDLHVYVEYSLWTQIQQIAKTEDRSVTATARILLREAVEARGTK